MTDEELAAIQVANAQTEAGPWSFGKSIGGVYIFTADGRALARMMQGDIGDAAWIAQSRQYVPALLAEVERLRSQNAAMREIVQSVASGGRSDDFSNRASYRLNYHIYASDKMREKARALLAAQPQEEV